MAKGGGEGGDKICSYTFTGATAGKGIKEWLNKKSLYFEDTTSVYSVKQ